MKKFVIATYFPEKWDKVQKSGREFENRVPTKQEELLKATFKNHLKDVVILDLNSIEDSSLEKLINTGLIDCFAFSPETVSSQHGKNLIQSIIKADISENRNIRFLNLYDGKDEKSVQLSKELGDVLLEDSYKANLTHIDIMSNEKLISQNFKGIKNDVFRKDARENQIKKDAVEILDLTEKFIENMANEEETLYTSKHIRSVALIAEQIAKKMNRTEEEIEIIKIGALLHDIGKNEISTSILNKPGFLTDKERYSMQQHVIMGELELNQFDFGKYEKIKEVVAEHHEKFDGSGYPRGLKENQISIYSRILAVADIANAVSGGRAYQKGTATVQRIEDVLLEDSGRKPNRNDQFSQTIDPEIVDVFLEILKKDPASIGYYVNENGEVTWDVPDVSKILDKEKIRAKKEKEKFGDSLSQDYVVSADELAANDANLKVDSKNPDIPSDLNLY